MSRRHGARGHYPEGYAEHSVDMDWRKERDADVDMKGLMYEDDPNHDPELAREFAINLALNEQLEKTVARAELAEYVLVGVAKRVRIYVAAALIVGIFIGYIAGFITK